MRICPMCDGEGVEECETCSGLETRYFICKGCDGKGLVTSKQYRAMFNQLSFLTDDEGEKKP